MSSDAKSLIFRSRVVDSVLAQKVLAFACGFDVCSQATFQGRVIDAVRGLKVFGVASECRNRSQHDDLFMVAQNCNPPLGVTNRLRIRFFINSLAVVTCFEKPCPETELVWDSVSSSWKGTLAMTNGTVSLEFKCTVSGGI